MDAVNSYLRPTRLAQPLGILASENGQPLKIRPRDMWQVVLLFQIFRF